MRIVRLSGHCFVLAALVLTSICIPVAASAQTTQPAQFVPLANYQRSSGFTKAFSDHSLPEYFNDVFTIVLSIGAILAVLRIAYAGYMYMGSADMWGNKQQAKEILGDAVIGLLLLFGIYLVLNQINPNLLNLDILKNIHHANATTCKSANCTGVYGSPDVTAETTASISSQPVAGQYCFQANSGSAQVYGCLPTLNACLSASSRASGAAQQSITGACQQY